MDVVGLEERWRGWILENRIEEGGLTPEVSAITHMLCTNPPRVHAHTLKQWGWGFPGSFLKWTHLPKQVGWGREAPHPARPPPNPGNPSQPGGRAWGWNPSPLISYTILPFANSVFTKHPVPVYTAQSQCPRFQPPGMDGLYQSERHGPGTLLLICGSFLFHKVSKLKSAC